MRYESRFGWDIQGYVVVDVTPEIHSIQGANEYTVQPCAPYGLTLDKDLADKNCRKRNKEGLACFVLRVSVSKCEMREALEVPE